MDGPILRIPLDPSRRLAGALLLMHALALACVWLGPALPGLRPALSLLCIASLLRERQRARAGMPLELRHGDAGFELLEGGRLQPAQVLGDSVLWPWLLVLRLRLAEGRVRSLVLLADSADADALRRLRVVLRMRRGAQGTSTVSRAFGSSAG